MARACWCDDHGCAPCVQFVLPPELLQRLLLWLQLVTTAPNAGSTARARRRHRTALAKQWDLPRIALDARVAEFTVVILGPVDLNPLFNDAPLPDLLRVSVEGKRSWRVRW